MELKRYQDRVLREVKQYLDLLAAEQAAGNKHAALDAWEAFKNVSSLSGNYAERKNGLNRDLPTFCIKVPTGGGKTLLATQILGSIHQTLLKDRNGTGLVLWVVPSDQIYKDTLKTFRDPRHMYRVSLEFALSHRLEVWEKQEIHRLTPSQLANNLNVLLLKLPSTNRQDREQLKFFRDSGGNIVQHFPAEDDWKGHRALKARFPNLEVFEEDQPQRAQRNAENSSLRSSALSAVKTSLANLVRIAQPAVILDEGHKATSSLARATIEGFNPAIVVELSATPKAEANVLVRVTGKELLDEQMIKLPINISNSNQKSWKDCLTQARDKRVELAKQALKHFKETGQTIRPIVLVQVERTGADQLDAGKVHSEDVKKHLIERLGVEETAIAIKSSEKDDIEGMDLLDEGCPVEWIITKAALQEGWDCPFAYILVSLNNTASQQSMTQLVGRVLRQPYVRKTASESLNECYVFCLRKRAEDISKEVKKALEQEGYDGDAASVVDSSGATPAPLKRQTKILPKFSQHYRKPFEGKIYLPRFCVKNGKEDYERLDYYRHLLSRVDVDRFEYADVNWDLADAMAQARDQFYRITLGQEGVERVRDQEAPGWESDEQVQAWLIANMPFDYFSHKQNRRIVERIVGRLVGANVALQGRLALVKFVIREKLVGVDNRPGFIEKETNRQTERAFKSLFDSGKLCFFLECVACRFEIPAVIDVRITRQLQRTSGDFVQRHLYDFRADDMNEYETSVALYIDEHPEVLWWYRNYVGAENFAIQGFRRSPIYPDFLVQKGKDHKPVSKVLVVESKGKHLQGNEDTAYKRSIAEYFEKAGRRVPWQHLANGFADHTFRFQILDQGQYTDRDWKDDLKRLLEE